MNILIVDDSKAMRMIVKRSLRQVGYPDDSMQEADNGNDALTSIKTAKPDVVLCDWNMPGMSGIDLLKALKGDGIDVKFGFITSIATPEIRQEAEGSGALFVIGKPFAPEKLKEALDKVL